MYSIAIIGLAVLIPLFFLFGFKWGISFSQDEEKAVETPVIPKPSKKKRDETAEQRRKRIEAQNIDNYHSPWSKQEEIK